MKEFKISCHAIGKLMAGQIGLTEVQEARLQELSAREKDAAAGEKGAKPLTQNMVKELAGLISKRENPELPQGAKTFLKTWIKEKMFNRKPEWKAIVVEKGLACEQQGIDLIGKIYGIDDLFKNDEFFHNDYMHGFPDIVHDVVRDVKSSWDLFTFPMFDDSMPDSDYWWQLQGYMELTGIKKASVDYVLIDTPLPLVQLDLKKLYFQSGGKAEDWNPDTHQALLPNYQFNDIPEALRVKSFTVEYDPTVPAQIQQRVVLARNFIKSIIQKTQL